MVKTELSIKLTENLSKQLNADLSKIKNIVENTLLGYHISKEETAVALRSNLREIATLFLACRRQDGLSPKTIQNYTFTLTNLVKVMQKNAENITTMDIRKYLLMYQQTHNPGVATVGNEIIKLRSFFKWLVDQEYIPKNPVSKIPIPKPEKKMRDALSAEEMELVRSACATSRERALIECLYSTGGRVSEVQALNANEIDWQDLSLKVWGKGSKEREVYISPQAKVHIQRYVQNRKTDSNALFVSEREPHGRLSVRAIQKIVGEIGRKAGLKREIFPHLFRHTVATTMLNSGATLTEVQGYLGHENIGTTQIYAKMDKSAVKIAHSKYVR
jgi:integrase/recombinase XerD